MKNLLLITLVVVAVNTNAQILKPILVQRELELSPVLRERLVSNRAILAKRKVNFTIG